MEIVIEYLTKNDKSRKKINIKPNLFFDEDEDGFNIDSIPRNIFPYEYLDVSKKELILVSLSIKDNNNFVRRDMFFWNDGKNETDYYISSSFEKKEIFEWMILSKIYKDKNKDNILESTKMLKDENGTWLVVNNCLTNLDDYDSDDVYLNVYKDKLGYIDGFRVMN